MRETCQGAIRTLCFYLCLVSTVTPIVAQRPDSVTTHRLPEVEVVERRSPAELRQGAPLQVMTHQTMEQLGIQTLAEAIRRFSGVTLKDYGGIGGLKTVSIRSLGAHHTAVAYDGVTINDTQSGQVDISRFSLDQIEVVTLAIGQSDQIFQTARLFASAGALMLQSKRPTFTTRPYRVSAKLQGGSFGLLNGSLLYEQRLAQKWSISLTGDLMRAKGDYPYMVVNKSQITHEKRINSDIRTMRFEGNLYGEFKKGSLLFKNYYYSSERGLPGSINYYIQKPTERLWNDHFFSQIHYKTALNDVMTMQTVAKYSYSMMRYQDVDDKYASGMQEDLNKQQEGYASAGLLYAPNTHLSASLSSDFAYATLQNNFMQTPSPQRYTSLTALAVHYQINRLNATGTLLGSYITEQVKVGERPPDKQRLSPALSVSWRPLEEQTLRLRASYKQIFRVPTFLDLYYLRMGNRMLKPENATQYNLGVTWSGQCGRWLNQLTLSLDGYYNHVDNKIVALPTLYIWRMMNMDEVKIKGIDANLTATIALTKKVNLLLAANYMYQHAIDVTDDGAKNYRHQLPYTPRHSGTGSLTIEHPWINISYLLTTVGERYTLPQNIEQNLIAPYTEQSVSFNRTFNLPKCRLRLQGEVINITGSQYDVIKFYPMPGRSFRLTTRIIL